MRVLAAEGAALVPLLRAVEKAGTARGFVRRLIAAASAPAQVLPPTRRPPSRGCSSR